MTLSDQIIDFYTLFNMPTDVPDGVVIHNPFDDKVRKQTIIDFCEHFYNDDGTRAHILGINPSRLTPTSTGVNYTDGFALQEYCGIQNSFTKTRELTSEFFYRVVHAMEGPQAFYSSVFAWALMPLSVTAQGKYTNHYHPDVAKPLRELLRQNLLWLAELPKKPRAVILGLGDNKKVFDELNAELGVYDQAAYLPHPRWVMQYNRADADKYVQQYVTAITSA